jgi:hypothetical protein
MVPLVHIREDAAVALHLPVKRLSLRGNQALSSIKAEARKHSFRFHAEKSTRSSPESPATIDKPNSLG